MYRATAISFILPPEALRFMNRHHLHRILIGAGLYSPFVDICIIVGQKPAERCVGTVRMPYCKVLQSGKIGKFVGALLFDA